ncbi:chemotaxis response regulator protein-glutamate methylesterase [Nitrospira defluvii]|nr:chemotaxis response regulator protein-glutamate methylesterase [Nitrospira defluvii]
MKKIRVLIIDDSALMRQVLTALLSEDKEIEVIGTAPDPYVARDKIKALDPDVLTLDVEMPRMDGLTFLEKLMAGHPMPVVMVSSLTEVGCETTLRALELGAIDYFTKPKFDMAQGMEAEAEELCTKVKVAARAKIFARSLPRKRGPHKKRSLKSSSMLKTTDTIIAVGASTGGTEALKAFLMELPPDVPPIVITQHMPENFTKTFSERLNDLCRISVKEAEEGDSVIAGHAFIAPGDYHMKLFRSGARYQIRLNQQERVNHHRPAVDVLFDSVAEYAGKNTIGIIMTGMGKDGAVGMQKMKEAGAYNFAQDEASSVVFGMPKEAITLGGVDEVCPLQEIASRVLARLSN